MRTDTGQMIIDLVVKDIKNNISFNAIVGNLKLVLKDKSYIKTSNLLTNSIKNIYVIDNWARKTALKIVKKNKY